MLCVLALGNLFRFSERDFRLSPVESSVDQGYGGCALLLPHMSVWVYVTPPRRNIILRLLVRLKRFFAKLPVNRPLRRQGLTHGRRNVCRYN